MTGNDIISCFRSAVDRVHATSLPTSPSQNERSEKSRKLLELATSKLSAALPSIAFTFPGKLPYQVLLAGANCINVFIFGHDRVAISRQRLNRCRKVYSFGKGDSNVNFSFCKPLDVIAVDLEKQGSSGPAVNIIGYFPIITVFKSHLRIDAWACTNAFVTSDSKHYIRQSLRDECRRVSHCSPNWWDFN